MLLAFLSLLLLCFYVEAQGQLNETNEYEDAKNYFTDDFGRNVMFVLAAAAHSNEPEKCLRKHWKVPDVEVVGRYTTNCGPWPFEATDKCFGYTAVLHSRKAIILSFRGVDQALELLLRKFQGVFENKVPVFGGGKVGRYFHYAYNSIRVAGMKEDLLAQMSKYPDYAIWVTGHSLGGSIASIAAHEMAANDIYKGRQIVVVTFGEPRTGDIEFAIAHNELLKYAFRVVHSNDIMPHTPINVFGYHQYKYEVWYDNNMESGASFKMCEKPEDETCSEGRGLSLSPFDHLNYYNHFILTYADKECLGF